MILPRRFLYPLYQGFQFSYDEDDDEYVFDEIADIIYGDETTPETEMLRSLVFEEIQTALADLPKEQREVFEMTELLDFSVKEAAEKTHTPVKYGSLAQALRGQVSA